MTKKCVISAVVMFVLYWALSFVVHGLLLGADYSASPAMRQPPEAQPLMGWMILAFALFGTAFAWIYVQGKDDKPWPVQGLRFGIAMALVTVVPTYLIYHVVTPVPFALAMKQIVFDTVRVVLMGLAVAWINR